MRKSIIILCLILPFLAIGQDDLSKNCKKMGLDESQVAITDETVSLFPRGFIYDANDPDSVSYFACFASDLKTLKAYFKEGEKNKMVVNQSVLRSAGDVSDTIMMEKLRLKIKRFKDVSGTKSFTRDPNAKYVIMYYWHKDMLDKKVIKTIKALNKYCEGYEEKIQFIAVTTK